MAEQQEIQTLVRVADAAMSGQPAPADFPDPVPERFPEGAGLARVGADHPDARSGEDAERRADALPSRDAARHDGAARRRRRPPAPDKNAKDNKDKDKDKNKNQKAPVAAAARRAELSVRRRLVPRPEARRARPAAADSARHRRPRRQLRSLHRPARARRTGGGAGSRARRAGTAAAGNPAVAGKTAVLKQPLDVPNYAGEFSSSTVILAERVDTLPAPITPDAQSEHPYAFGQTEIVVVAGSQVQEVAGADRPAAALQPDGDAREEVQPRGDLHLLPAGRRHREALQQHRAPDLQFRDAGGRVSTPPGTAASRPARGFPCRASRTELIAWKSK